MLFFDIVFHLDGAEVPSDVVPECGVGIVVESRGGEVILKRLS